MSLREKLNRSPLLVGAVTVIVILIAGWYLFSYVFSTGQPAQPKKAYFTVDDGKTFFVDSIDRVVPFEHEGKEAVRAMVYTCDEGKTTFVGYLMKLSPDGKRKAEARKAEAEKREDDGKPASPGDSDSVFDVLVKKPGETQWAPSASQAGTIAQTVKCPSGGVLDMKYP